MAFNDANNLYVTEWGNHRVQVLTTEGQFLRALSQKINGQQLAYPRAIAIDSNNTECVHIPGRLHHHVWRGRIKRGTV